MRIDHVQKDVTLLGISDGARVRGKYDITVDGQSFYSVPVFERSVRRGKLWEIIAVNCFCGLPVWTFSEVVNAALIAGNNEIVFVEVETKARTTMQVNSIETELRTIGRGPKNYQPGKQTGSLMIDNQRIAHLTIYFSDLSSEMPEATVQDNIGTENESLLIEALAAGRECLLLEDVPSKNWAKRRK